MAVWRHHTAEVAQPLLSHTCIAGCSTAENGLNHSGLDSWLLDLVTLKSLTFRAPASFHDAHHKFSNHAHNAKNYGESLWLWDWMFGTTSLLTGKAAWKVRQAQ
eukprot:GHUV01050652.1.p2 GENE.GHUV01050652.1~~GHUV01050652.1.p2  ORF type:complete len:104 (+),score=4.89 GHUV01050652.1:360-671(+)